MGVTTDHYEAKRRRKSPGHPIPLPVPKGTLEAVEAAIAKGRVTIPAGVFHVFPNKFQKRPLYKWRDRFQPIHFVHAYLWGYRTGADFGLVVLDFDGEGGVDVLKRSGLQPHHQTGSGGFHVEVEHPGWPVRKGRVLPGVDVQGDDKIAYFAGRSHKGEYRTIGDHPPYPVAEIPEWLRRPTGLWKPPPPPAAQAPTGTWEGDGDGTPEAVRLLGWWCAQIRTAAEGTSNGTFHRAVCGAAGLAAAGLLDPAVADRDLMAAADDRDVDDPSGVFASSWAFGFARPWDPDAPVVDIEDDDPAPPDTPPLRVCAPISPTTERDAHSHTRTHSESDADEVVTPDFSQAIHRSGCPVWVTSTPDPRTGKGRSGWAPCRTLGCALCRPEQLRRKKALYAMAFGRHSSLHIGLVAKAQLRGITEKFRRQAATTGKPTDYIAWPHGDGFLLVATLPFKGSQLEPVHRVTQAAGTAIDALPPRTYPRASRGWKEKALTEEENKGRPKPPPTLARTHKTSATVMEAILRAHGAVITSRKRGLEWFFPAYRDPIAVERLRISLEMGVVPVAQGRRAS